MLSALLTVNVGCPKSELFPKDDPNSFETPNAVDLAVPSNDKLRVNPIPLGFEEDDVLRKLYPRF